MERMRRQIVEEERQRLLREHAPKLVGYLPKVCYCSNHVYTVCLT